MLGLKCQKSRQQNLHQQNFKTKKVCIEKLCHFQFIMDLAVYTLLNL